MRGLVVTSLLVLGGCASAPPQSAYDQSIAVRPPPPIERPWIVPQPADEITLFDTRMLQALRNGDDIPALNAHGPGRVQRPGMWVGIGVGSALGLAITYDALQHLPPY